MNKEPHIYKEEHGKLLPLPEVKKPIMPITMDGREERGLMNRYDKDLAAYNSWLDSGITVSPELKLKDGGVYAFFEHVDYLLLVDKKALSTNLDWVITNKGNIYAPNQGLVFKSGITCDKIVAYKPLHKNADRLEGLPLLAVPLPQGSNECAILSEESLKEVWDNEEDDKWNSFLTPQAIDDEEDDIYDAVRFYRRDHPEQAIEDKPLSEDLWDKEHWKGEAEHWFEEAHRLAKIIEEQNLTASNSVSAVDSRPKNFDVHLKAALDRRLKDFPYDLKSAIDGRVQVEFQWEAYNKAISLIIDDLLKNYFIVSKKATKEEVKELGTKQNSPD
jgi:hypothetical protein